MCFEKSIIIVDVAPHAGAWIEIDCGVLRYGVVQSLPMRERGLKYLVGVGAHRLSRRSPCGSVD